MTVYFPDGVSSLGKEVWMWTAAVAVKAAMTLAETAVAGNVLIQMALRPGFGPDADTNRISDPRLGAFIQYEAFGITTNTLSDATFIDRPQDAAGGAMNKHIETLADGAVGYLINRRGLGSAPENWQAWAVGQKYRLYPVALGPQVPLATTDEGGQFEYKQSIIITGPVVKGTLV